MLNKTSQNRQNTVGSKLGQCSLDKLDKKLKQLDNRDALKSIHNYKSNKNTNILCNDDSEHSSDEMFFDEENMTLGDIGETFQDGNSVASSNKKNGKWTLAEVNIYTKIRMNY